MRKIIALAMATLMVAAMAFTAFAVNITINADKTFTSGTSGSDVGSLYTWYRVFTAVMDTSGTTSGTGGSGSFWYDSGTKSGLDASSFGKVAYTASNDVATKILAAGGTADSGTGVITSPYFILTPIAGKNPTEYSVTWNGDKDNDGTLIRAAADWLYANKIWDATGSFTYDDATKQWTSGEVVPGYYVVAGAVGKNLIAATTDINITEKNEYPSLDKTQADEDSGTQSDDPRKVAVGDVLNYEVKVKIPDTVKDGDILEVWDAQTKGLTYNKDVKAYIDDAVVTAGITDGTLKTGEAWRKVITITKDNLADFAGKEVVFKFTMTVNANALVDTGKENEAGLEYGDKSGTYFETIPDHVDYEVYYTGIVKVDGNQPEIKLEGVEFTLRETDKSGTTVDYPVVLSGSFYYPATSGTSGSATVKTDASGTILIRGLDGDKTYTLIETKTNQGYNLLSGSVQLELAKETSGTDYTATTQLPFTTIKNFSGTVLPSTGGIGTTIFYIVGGLLAVGAGVVLVTRKRMGEEK